MLLLNTVLLMIDTISVVAVFVLPEDFNKWYNKLWVMCTGYAFIFHSIRVISGIASSI